MTKTVPLVLAYALFINELHILFYSSVFYKKYLPSNLVFLLSACLILRNLEFFPASLWQKSPKLCYVLEIPVAIICMEILLYYIWKPIQVYIASNADAILVHLVEDRGLEWFVCHTCSCGQGSIFTDVALKAISFAVLMTVCYFNRNI